MTSPSAAAPVVLAIQSDPTDPPGLVGEWLADAGLEVRVVRAYAGEPVPDRVPADVDGLLPLGGAMAAWEDDAGPWLPATRALLVDAVARDVPVLGLCLGGQLLAMALGGVVDRARVAEVGVVQVRFDDAVASDAVFSSVAGQSRPAAQWHGDAILQPPPGAVLLAGNDDCPVQAFRFGECAYGLQFHPEVDGAIIGSWASDDDGPMIRAGRVGDDIGAEVDAALPDLVAAWRTPTLAWAALVRAAADRRRSPTG